MTTTIGFFEESANVRSMTRLCAFLMALAVVLLAIGLVAYLLIATLRQGGKPDAGVITAFAAPMVPLAGGIWGALRARTGGDT